MKGLILKDILCLKSYGRTAILFAVIWLLISLIGGSASFAVSFVFAFIMMLPISGISLDEKCGFGLLEACLPIPRAHVVISKYLFTLLLAAAAYILCFAVSLISGSAAEFFAVYFYVFLIFLMFISVALPVIFKYGSGKGRLIFLICFAAIFAAFYFELFNADSIMRLHPAAIIIFTAAIFVLSVIISCRIYEKKEF